MPVFDRKQPTVTVQVPVPTPVQPKPEPPVEEKSKPTQSFVVPISVGG